MKILIYGAGVIGCVYAARLHRSGGDVTLLARGENYENLKQNGIAIMDMSTKDQIVCNLPLTQQLSADGFYDLIIVTVRLDQIETVMRALKNNMVSPVVMFMLNNPADAGELTKKLPRFHIISGFPGVGGAYRGNVIEYIQIAQQKTTIGEYNGKRSALIRAVKLIFEYGGFKVKISSDISAWLKTHALFVTCLTASVIKENGDSVQLGKKKKSIAMMVKSIYEGFTALYILGIPILPLNLRIIFMIMPQWFAVLYWQKAMQGEIGTLTIAPHANAAKGEMQLLSKKILLFIHSSSHSTPTLDKLLSDFQLPS